MDKKILDFIRQRKVTFFIGAGVSMIPPSCLPSWWQVNHLILNSLADESCSIVPEVKHLTSLIKEREKDEKLPPEFVAEIITDRIGKSYFEVLQGLEGDIPNQVHLWLATLAKAGLLTAIITTNFDTLIEKAFEIIGVPLSVFVDPEDYEKIPSEEDLVFNINTPCMLLKLHGTATQPNTCVDTLAQRKRGLHPNIIRALNILGYQTFWIFLGYSGADIEADASYLGIRARMNNSPGFAWLHLPDKRPLSVVSKLAELYGVERGLIEFDVLPEWLKDLETIIPDQINPPHTLNLSMGEIQKIRDEKMRKIKSHSLNWAKMQGKAVCAIILTDIGMKAAYQGVSRTVLMKLLDGIGDDELSPFGLGLVNLQLGDIAHHFGKNKDALSYYQKASKYFQDVDHAEGFFASLQGIAIIQQNFGYFSEAEKALKDFLEYTLNHNDTEGYIHGLLDMGSLYREMGKLQEGLKIYNDSISLAVQHGLEILHAHALLGLALIENLLGNPENAENHAIEASKIYSRLGDDSFLSETLRELAQIRYKRGDIQEAFKFLEEAKKKAYLVGNNSRMVRAEHVHGVFLQQLGNYADAITILKKASKTAEDLGDFNLILSIWQNIGLTLQMQGNLDEAYEVYQKALINAEKVDLDVKIAGLRNNLGIISEQRGQLNDALKHYLAAEEIFKRTGQLESLAGSQGNIANINFRLGNFQESNQYYEKVLKIFKELEDIGGILRTQYNIANIVYQSGEIEQSKNHYQNAIELAEQYGQIGLRDTFQLNYAGVLFQLEEYSAAIELYKKTYMSSKERKDYYQAGMASYYAGLGLIRVNNQKEAINAIEESISLWKMLEEEPPQVKEARNLLQSLRQEI
ncbi:MAG: tetratricopeptide repeat protein [Promethearchaeota archaeon]